VQLLLLQHGPPVLPQAWQVDVVVVPVLVVPQAKS
jgi:hypothetical protein